MGQSAGKAKLGTKAKPSTGYRNNHAGTSSKQVYNVGNAKRNGGKSKGYWKSSGADSLGDHYIWATPDDGGSCDVGGSGYGYCVTSSNDGGCTDAGFSSGGSSDTGCSSSSSSDSSGCSSSSSSDSSGCSSSD